MIKPEIHDGLLEAFMRRERRAVRAAIITAAVAVAPVLSLYGYLVWKNQDLTTENARLRDACGVKGRP